MKSTASSSSRPPGSPRRASMRCRSNGWARGARGRRWAPLCAGAAAGARAAPQLHDVASDFLARHELVLEDIDRFVCHPGGTKVVAALEDAFRLGRGALVEASGVLRDYGNMSAATVLFVLDRMLAAARSTG